MGINFKNNVIICSILVFSQCGLSNNLQDMQNDNFIKYKKQPLRIESNLISAIDYNPEGTKLAIAKGPNIEIKSLKKDNTNEDIFLIGHTDKISAISYSEAEDNCLISGGFDSKVIFHKKNGKEQVILDYDKKIVLCFKINYDNSLISVGGAGNIKLWGIDGKKIGTIACHKGPISCIENIPEENHIISGSWDSTFGVHDILELKTITAFYDKKCKKHINSILYIKDLELLISAYKDKTITLWDFRQKLPVNKLKIDINNNIEEDTIFKLSQGISENSIITGEPDKLRIWDIRKINNKSIDTFNILGNDRINAFSINKINGHIAVGCNYDILIWEPTKPITEENSQLKDYRNSIYQFEIDANNSKHPSKESRLTSLINISYDLGSNINFKKGSNIKYNPINENQNRNNMLGQTNLMAELDYQEPCWCRKHLKKICVGCCTSGAASGFGYLGYGFTEYSYLKLLPFAVCMKWSSLACGGLCCMTCCCYFTCIHCGRKLGI